MAIPFGDSDAFEEDDDQLDFEDDNYQEYPSTKVSDQHAPETLPEQKVTGKPCNTGDSTSRMEYSHSADEGELQSEAETDASEDKSSEEGEISSEIEEVEVAGDHSPAKEETPWERGLRLAHERLERAKLLKAAEKDLAEKRMNLEVPTSAVEPEQEVAKEDVFWPCYYQAFIIGRTELTGRRFLPEDLQPPTETELAEWRRGLDSNHHGRRQHRYRRASSRSTSSSASSSSRTSSHTSSSGSSGVSSLASVAASWKATCAKAMKDYLNSPLGSKGRRGRYAHGRWRRGQRGHSSRSSGSSSDSSDSRSLSDVPRSRAGLASRTAGTLATQGVRRMWPEEDRRPGRRGKPGSSRSSSGSGSRSHSSHESTDTDRRRAWKYGPRGCKDGGSEGRSSSQESTRDRREVPPLPHERPVKRPWVAAPGLASASATSAQNRQRTRDSSQSHSDSPPPADEKRFITSWSRSPSSGGERRTRDTVTRERLPDVVPGSHRAVRGATPSRKKKSRSPFAGIRGPPPNVDHTPLEVGDLTGYPSAIGQQSVPGGMSYAVSSSIPDGPPPAHLSYTPSVSGPNMPDRPELDRPAAGSTHGTETPLPSQTGGELPLAPNRPGVRLTLAPRLKASAVGIASLTGATNRPSNRPFQPSPPPQSRAHRLPLPSSLTERGSSPGAPPPNPATLTSEQIRIQAEAAAAVVEARERRRAAAEAARRHRNPNRRKRSDLSKIPIRGRPTYRRQSFSSSSSSSSSAHSSRSHSSAASSARSKSASASRSTSPQTPDSRCDDPYGLSNRPDYQPSRGNYARRGGVGLPRRGGPSHFGRDEYRDQPEDYYNPQYGRPTHHGMNMQQSFQFQSHNLSEEGGRVRDRVDYGRADRGLAPFKHRGGYEISERQRAPYKTQSIKMANDYPVDMADVYPAPPKRHRGDLKVAVLNPSRYDAFEELDQQRFPALPRRVISQAPPAAERLVRPRTPHGVYEEPLMDRRSPRMSEDHRVRGTDRIHSRKDDRDLDMGTGATTRKRAYIIAPPEVEPPVLNLDMRRARARHRSRGPGGSGAPIDRSEPFESDAGSFAAEQRLRELRERLNLVDDRIAEIKAGSAR